MNFHLPVKDAPKQFINEAVTVFRGTNTLLTDKFRMFFIDLLYFDKTEESVSSSLLDCWIYSIKNMGKKRQNRIG
ncbi:MAG: PD-(D/E)XK nuclease family transposase [Bacteroidales bacterium]|nr:PD-(D/E)XK nuclease family transposase [Bacteroidales bacterium]